MHIKQARITDAAIVLYSLAAGLLSGRTKDVPQRSRYSVLLPFLCVKSGENEKLHVASLMFAEDVGGRKLTANAGSRLIAAKKHDVAVPDGGPPGGIAAKALHHRQGFDERPVLGHDPSSVAIGPANRVRKVNGASMGARQQLYDERRAIALDRLSSTLEDFHFATLNVDLDDPNFLEGVAIKGAYRDIEAQNFRLCLR
jgi:hypothetical protein